MSGLAKLRFSTAEQRETAELILDGLLKVDRVDELHLMIDLESGDLKRVVQDLKKGWWVLRLGERREVLGFGGEAEMRVAFLKFAKEFISETVILSNGNIPQMIQRKGILIRRFA